MLRNAENATLPSRSTSTLQVKAEQAVDKI
jgi:hypothetical protein